MKNTSKLEATIKVVYTAGDTFMSIVKEVRAVENIFSHVFKIINQSKQESQQMGELLGQFTRQYQENQKCLIDLNETFQHQFRTMDEMSAIYDKIAATVESSG
jgi:methyl-accepting chemotaxis protein